MSVRIESYHYTYPNSDESVFMGEKVINKGGLEIVDLFGETFVMFMVSVDGNSTFVTFQNPEEISVVSRTREDDDTEIPAEDHSRPLFLKEGQVLSIENIRRDQEVLVLIDPEDEGDFYENPVPKNVVSV